MFSTWLDAFTFMVVCIFNTGGEVKQAEAFTPERQRQEPGATESLSLSINPVLKDTAERKKQLAETFTNII